MNNFYVDFKKHGGKLVDPIGNIVTPDMNNDEHVKALKNRQHILENGIDKVSVDTVLKCTLRFDCACGQRISISAEAEANFDLGDTSVDLDADALKLDEFDYKCWHCGTEYVFDINDDNEVIIKPKN